MNSSDNWVLKIRDSIYKALAKFPIKDRMRLSQIIEELPANPYRGDIEKMGGQLHAWRRRVGAYRIFYEIIAPEKVIYVFRVERRTSATY